MLTRQQCKTYLARLKVYIGMTDRCFESDFGRREGVVGGDDNREKPEAAEVGGDRVTRAFEDGFPVEQVGVRGRAEMEDGVVGARGELRDFVR